MNKYRCLNDEELRSMEDDFKAFLIINGVDTDYWQTINKEKPERAIELVELFSDLVFEKIVTSIVCLINIQPEVIHLIKKEENILKAIWIKPKEPYQNKGLFSEFNTLNTEHIECYFGTKTPENINKECFNLLKMGYTKTDLKSWDMYFDLLEKDCF